MSGVEAEKRTNCCILIAGMPATGKTTFAEYACRVLDLPMISRDKIKEILYDTIGFHNHAEKVALSISATQLLYHYAESLMRTGQAFILENNFENVSKPGLVNLLEQYGYRAVTVRFGGDIKVIYQRYLERDTKPDRHGGHKTQDSWPQGQDSGVFAAPLSADAFLEGVKSRGIAEFSIGEDNIFVDATDYSRISYEAIITQIRWEIGRY